MASKASQKAVKKSPMKSMKASLKNPKKAQNISKKHAKSKYNLPSPSKASPQELKKPVGVSDEDEGEGLLDEEKARMLSRIEFLRAQRQLELQAVQKAEATLEKRAAPSNDLSDDEKPLSELRKPVSAEPRRNLKREISQVTSEADSGLYSVGPSASAFQSQHLQSQNLGSKSLGSGSTEIVPYNQSPMSLDEKMRLFRQGQLDEAAFSRKEMHCVSAQFNHARAKDPRLAETYKVNSTLKSGKMDKKAARHCMLAWMKSPCDVTQVVSSMNQLQGQEGLKKEAGWLTLKQVYDHFGEEEAQEMLDDGLLTAKPNPQNPKRFVYKVVTEKEFKELGKKSAMVFKKESHVSEEEAVAVRESFQHTTFGFDMLRTAALDCGLDLNQALQDPDFKRQLEETAGLKSAQLAPTPAQEACSDLGSHTKTIDYEEVKAQVEKEQLEDAARKKKEKELKRAEHLAKRQEKEAKLGMEALEACQNLQDPSEADVLAMMKEVLFQGHKCVASGSLLRAKLTKDRYAQGFIREFQVVTSALNSAYEATLNTQGLYQAKKCNFKFALKAIASLAKATLKMKSLQAQMR